MSIISIDQSIDEFFLFSFFTFFLSEELECEAHYSNVAPANVERSGAEGGNSVVRVLSDCVVEHVERKWSNMERSGILRNVADCESDVVERRNEAKRRNKRAE